MRTSGTIAGFVLSALAASGSLISCMVAHSDTMLFGTNTKFAFDVSLESTTQTPTFTVGYKRQEFVWMPLVVNGEDSKCVGGGCPNVPAEGAVKKAAAEIEAAEKEAAETASSSKEAADKAAKASGSDKAAAEALAKERAAAAKAAKEKLDAAKAALAEVPAAKSGPGKLCEFCKYVGNDGDDKDTYSVLASFGTTYNAGTNAGGSIAQYFATGHAARILAATGGSGLVNTKSADAQTVKALIEQQRSDIDKIIEHVKKDDADEVDEGKLKPLATAANLSQGWIDRFKNKPTANLRAALSSNYSNYVGTMAAAIK